MANVYVYSGAGGAGTGADWANAYTTLAAALTAKAAGDVFYVADGHAEPNTAAAVTLTSPGTAAAPCTILCALRSGGSVPPVSANLRTTAAINNTGSNNFNIAGYAYCYGIIFTVSSSTSGADFRAGQTSATDWTFEACKIALGGNSTGNAILIGASGGYVTKMTLINTTVKFAATGQGFTLSMGELVWRDTATAIDTGGSVPTTLFEVTGTLRSFDLSVRNVDFVALGSGKTLLGGYGSNVKARFENCKIDAAVTLAGSPTTPATYYDFANVAGTGINYFHARYGYAGTQVPMITVKRTGGYSDGTTGLTTRITTTADSEWTEPFRALPISRWGTTSTATVTIEGVADPRHFSALPLNDEFWMDVVYLGDASSAQGSKKSGTKADYLATGSSLTASTEAWDTGATARANTTVYAAGDIIKLASNPGRIFICTTGGTTAGSEPGGYATAIDGGSVVDNTATFKAGWRFKQTLILAASPAQNGLITAYPKMAKVSSVIYLDPKLTLA